MDDAVVFTYYALWEAYFLILYEVAFGIWSIYREFAHGVVVKQVNVWFIPNFIGKKLLLFTEEVVKHDLSVGFAI